MGLSILKKIFGSGDSSTNMTFYKLYSNMREWKRKKVYPYNYELPDSISFTDDFWKRIIQIYKATRADGYERAISVFWADGDLIISSVIKGSKSSVKINSEVSVRYVPTHKREYYTKEVLVGGVRYSKREVYYKKIPKQIEVKYLFNMHTHPPHKREDGSVYYSFFSVQDLRSQIASGAVISGMVGDRLWLLFRTNKTPNVLPEYEQRDVTIDQISERLGLAVYMGEFKQKLYRQDKPQ
jgi:hypothetical protein